VVVVVAVSAVVVVAMVMVVVMMVLGEENKEDVNVEVIVAVELIVMAVVVEDMFIRESLHNSALIHPLVSSLLCRYADMLDRLSTVIEPDTVFARGALASRTQKIFAVRAGVSGNLDVARRT
jgi:hypothetical protein